MAKQLDTVSDPTGEQSKEETNSPLKDKNQGEKDKEDKQAISPPFLEDKDNLKVQKAHQEGAGELAEQQEVGGEKAAPAALQQQLLKD